MTDISSQRRSYRLLENYVFLCRGTILKQDVQGSYFVSMSDEDYNESGIKLHGKPVNIEKHLVENKSSVFELIEDDATIEFNKTNIPPFKCKPPKSSFEEIKTPLKWVLLPINTMFIIMIFSIVFNQKGAIDDLSGRLDSISANVIKPEIHHISPNTEKK